MSASTVKASGLVLLAASLVVGAVLVGLNPGHVFISEGWLAVPTAAGLLTELYLALAATVLIAFASSRWRSRQARGIAAQRRRDQDSAVELVRSTEPPESASQRPPYGKVFGAVQRHLMSLGYASRGASEMAGEVLQEVGYADDGADGED